MRLWFTVLGAACIVFANGCTSESNRNEGENSASSTQQDSAKRHAPPGSGREVPGAEDVRLLVRQWDSAYNAHDASYLGSLYADKAEIAGQALSREEIVAQKKELFRAQPKYHQDLLPKMGIVPQGTDLMRATVTRKTPEGKNAILMLLVENSSQGWKIIAETDPQAYHRARMERAQPMKTEEITSCDKAAEAVVRSSPSIRSLMMRPKTELQLFQRPGENGNKTGQYVFRVIGKHSDGKVETYRYYQVDQRSGKLLQYAAPGQRPLPSPFDPALKGLIGKMCK